MTSKQLELRVANLDCEHDAAAIERGMRAMGAAGTDVALDAAHVALMADDLEKLVYALRLREAEPFDREPELALSAVVIGALVVGALAGVFSLPIAVIGHEVSEFVVIASGLRMLKT